MNTHTISRTSVTEAIAPARPGRLRRTAVAVTGFLTCALPTIFAFNISRMLLTGVESEHRFHQATGQGLLLVALWLGALLPLVRAGWSGRRPPTWAGLLHLAFVGTGVACSVVAPGGGAPSLMAVIGVPGILLWLALPLRPRLTGRFRVDPLVAPVALTLTALLTPYAVDQLALQNATTDPYHSQNPHMFDMAWLTVTIMVIAVLAAVLPAAGALLRWVAGSCLAIGVAGLAFGEGVVWSLSVLAVGSVATVVAVVQRRTAQ